MKQQHTSSNTVSKHFYDTERFVNFGTANWTLPNEPQWPSAKYQPAPRPMRRSHVSQKERKFPPPSPPAYVPTSPPSSSLPSMFSHSAPRSNRFVAPEDEDSVYDNKYDSGAKYFSNGDAQFPAVPPRVYPIIAAPDPPVWRGEDVETLCSDVLDAPFNGTHSSGLWRSPAVIAVRPSRCAKLTVVCRVVVLVVLWAMAARLSTYLQSEPVVVKPAAVPCVPVPPPSKPASPPPQPTPMATPPPPPIVVAEWRKHKDAVNGNPNLHHVPVSALPDNVIRFTRVFDDRRYAYTVGLFEHDRPFRAYGADLRGPAYDFKHCFEVRGKQRCSAALYRSAYPRSGLGDLRKNGDETLPLIYIERWFLVAEADGNVGTMLMEYYGNSDPGTNWRRDTDDLYFCYVLATSILTRRDTVYCSRESLHS